MKKASCLFLALLLLLQLAACTGTTPVVVPDTTPVPTASPVPTVTMPLSAEEFESFTCLEAEKKLRILGFEQITLQEYADLTSGEADRADTVRSISIGGRSRFATGDSFSADAQVVLQYHTVRTAVIPASPAELAGKDAEAIGKVFTDAGFVNVRTEVLEDLDPEAEPVSEASVDGRTGFSRDEELPFDTEVVILTHIPRSAYAGLTELTAEQIYARCAPAVFYVEIYDEYGWCTKTGSGFFLTPDGLAVTNYHVISGADSAAITVSDTGEVYDVLGVYDYSVDEDWAVIQIGGEGFQTLAVGSQDYDVGGATVYAIGSPLGLQNTISAGIISNPARLDDGMKYIQMSAAISPGSSGGALLNKYGQVIGITSATYTEGQNLNLAIPMTYLENANTEDWSPLHETTGIGPSGVLTLSDSVVRVGIGESFDVVCTAIESNCEDSVSVRYSIGAEDLVSCEWLGWVGDDDTLRITGLSVGSTDVTVYFLISGTDTVLDSKTIQVTVSPDGDSSGEDDVELSLDHDHLAMSLFASGELWIYAYYPPDNGNTYVSWYLEDSSFLNCTLGEWEGDNICLSLEPINSGTTELTIMYCHDDGRLLAEKTIPVTVFYASLEVSEEEIGLEPEGSQEVLITIRSDNPGLHTLRYSIYGEDVVSCSWGDWLEDGITCPLVITAVGEGDADVEIRLLDKDTQQFLYSVSIPVFVG